MDFLDPKKRRSYNIRLFVGMGLISIALILATTILALITAGYGISSKTGKVVQSGLVFINSQPVSSNIFVNGVSYGRTNARLVLNSGSYNFKLQQTGYYNWSNTEQLMGGDVLQLFYPFLFPTNPKKTVISTLPSEPSIFSSTPDRHWLLASIPGQDNSFYNIDITNTKAPITTVTIPENILGSQNGDNKLTPIMWSNDNNHLLLKDVFSGGVNFIMFDRTDPASSFNINQTFSGTAFTNVVLNNKAYDSLYLQNQTDGDLYQANVGAKSVNQILTGVISFWPYSTDQVLYVTADTKNPNQVVAKLWNANGQNNILRYLPLGSNYELNMASYNNDLYVVIGSNASTFAYVYKNPSDQFATNPNQLPLPDTLLIVNGTPEQVSFSASARFISLQSGNQFSVYDIQYDNHYRYSTNLAFLPNQLATWMDGNRLDAVINGKLVVWDFDGANTVTFTDTTSDFSAAFNQTYSAVYTLIPEPNSASNQWQIVRNSLIVGTP